MNRTCALLLPLLTILQLSAPAGAAEPPRTSPAELVEPAEIDKRVDKILGQMTLEEKVDYIGGHNGFYIRGIPRLKVPEVKMADGPMGVRNYGPSTSYPAGIAMAASWDTEIEHRLGMMIGQDARARGVDIMLGPGMNIHRAPMCGRNFEYFGEDPFLASRMAVAVIKGMQSQGIIATAKHFAGNNQEWSRHYISSDIDERTLREIYLPAFEASVKEAGVGAIMNSYNLINGIYASQHGHLNNQIAKKEWGFRGIMMSDWESTYDGVGAANNGLDLEMPSAVAMNRKILLPAIKAGTVAEATIDDKVRRILRTVMQFGFFDRQQKTEASQFNQEGRRVALDAARGSMVLLKNDGLLPFDKNKTQRIAVIGPRAQAAIAMGGGSGRVNAIVPGSFLTGISNAAGSNTKILYSAGTPTPDWTRSRFTTTADGKSPGLTGEYFNNTDLQGKPVLTRTDEQINFRFGDRNSYGTGGVVNNFSARWSGYYKPRGTGDYTFYLAGSNGYRLYVDDKLLVDHWRNPTQEPFQWKTLPLDMNKAYKIRLEFQASYGTKTMRFAIGSGKNTAADDAAAVAAKADAVVLCVGFDVPDEGEGFDRTFKLPEGQNELVERILAANKRVVIVLNAGGNVDMARWVDPAAALLHAWYPGQEGGTALGDILFGAVSPSGKLPVTFERRWEDNPTHDSYYEKPAGSKRVAYSEGIFVGYRHYDKKGTKPLFAFGHGLSYTSFKYSNLKVTPATGKGDEPVKVSFDVSNTGKRAGAEVAQVYVGDRHAKVERPVKELKGFAKVLLKPGQRQRITVSLDKRAFSYYDVAGKSWRADPGDFEILVGGASDKADLKGKVTLTQ